MTEEEFADTVRGCDPHEACVVGNFGGSDFSFDCIMKRPEGDVCVSGFMTLDDDGCIEDVDSLTVSDYSEIGEGGDGALAPVITDPFEVGEILDQLSRRFTHESGDDDWPTGGPWTL